MSVLLCCETTLSVRGAASTTIRDGSLASTRTVTREDFRDAMLFTGAVAYLAEDAGHHPDILIQWNEVTLKLSTHSAGGLTAADFTLAGRISKLG